MDDRHGRHRRPPADRRRRPVDGFRTRDRARFARLVNEAARSLPTELQAWLPHVRVHVREVPPGDAVESGPPLAHYAGPALRDHTVETAGPYADLILYRRPLEARAHDRDDLGRLVRHVLVHELAHQLALSDEQIEDRGWDD